MRKKTMRMMIIAGAVALLLPTAAMAEWDQAEVHENQEDHDAMINVMTPGDIPGDFSYNMESSIGYDYKGDGSKAILNTDSPYAKKGQAPWNTTPCPIQLADTTMMFMWDDAMGNCPTQLQPAGWTVGQTDNGWKEGDNEMFGPILDDLYQSLSEVASTNTNENGEKAFKKVDQVLDILFYRANTVGEVYMEDGWTDLGGTHWLGGLGFDQTLDQDVADISGTTGNALGVPHGTWLWNYDHVAQTFYQDFRLWDKGNTFGGVGDSDYDGEISYKSGSTDGDYVDLGNSTKEQRGQQNPRNRHGIELLAACGGTGAGTGLCDDIAGNYDTTQDDGTGWGAYTIQNSGDFAFFDQWVIQSLKDSYTDNDSRQEYAPNTVVFWKGEVTLSQSYSSWMALGVPGVLCNEVTDSNAGDGSCEYVYEKDDHSVKKSIAENSSTHQTGDP